MALVNGKRVAKTAAAASVAAPYVPRLMSDAELRNEVRNLLGSASHLYSEMGKDDRLHALVHDRKIRKDVDHIVKSMQHAGRRVEKQTRRRSWGRYVVIGGLAGGTAAVLVYPKSRQRIMNTVGGARRSTVDTVEEFQEKAA